jgi:hypothetical protein
LQGFVNDVGDFAVNFEGLTVVRGINARVRGGFARVRGGFARVRGGFARVRGGFARVRGVFAHVRGVCARVHEAMQVRVASFTAARGYFACLPGCLPSGPKAVVGPFQRKCPTNFSLSWRNDKLKLIGHQTDPLPTARPSILEVSKMVLMVWWTWSCAKAFCRAGRC